MRLAPALQKLVGWGVWGRGEEGHIYLSPLLGSWLPGRCPRMPNMWVWLTKGQRPGASIGLPTWVHPTWKRDREREVGFPSPFAGAIYISGPVTIFFFFSGLKRVREERRGSLVSTAPSSMALSCILKSSNFMPTSLVYRPSNQKARGKEAS